MPKLLLDLSFYLLLPQAIQLGQDASSPHGLFNGQRCQMCLRSDPLHKVMERLAVPGKCLQSSICLRLSLHSCLCF
uniref:AMP-activated protein kinase, gamma regulatory subunit n=1 Tax=Solanum tuberosum TaxID=4113 RepID=M1CAZ5_SOLTU